ncbi:MAG: hypothetical protein OXH94_07575 [Rhodospirillales bacterium]|nr:hypothetical protein [Rhodospirillales bacterium]
MNPSIADGSPAVRRFALIVEILLIGAAAAGFLGVFVFMALAPSLLSPDESIVLANARVIRGASLMAFPLAIALLLPFARMRLTRLFAVEPAESRFAWGALAGITAILLVFAGTAVWGMLAELDFAG